MTRKSKYTKDMIESALKDSETYSEALIKLGLKAHGSNHKTLKDKIRIFNLNDSHIKGRSWSKNKTYKTDIRINNCRNKRRMSNEEIFIRILSLILTQDKKMGKKKRSSDYLFKLTARSISA